MVNPGSILHQPESLKFECNIFTSRQQRRGIEISADMDKGPNQEQNDDRNATTAAPEAVIAIPEQYHSEADFNGEPKSLEAFTTSRVSV